MEPNKADIGQTEVSQYDSYRQKAKSYWRYEPIALQRMMAKQVLDPKFDPHRLGLSMETIARQLSDEGLSENDLLKMRERKTANRAALRKAVIDALKRTYFESKSPSRDEAHGWTKINGITALTEVYFGREVPLTFTSSLRIDGKVHSIFPCFEDLINDGQNHWDLLTTENFDDSLSAFENVQGRVLGMAESL